MLLNTRYSGEYIKFGKDENNLYRIVSHETSGLTKITSAEPLKSSDRFLGMAFGNDVTFSIDNEVGTFLNGKYLTNYVDSIYSDMIEDNTTWYLGTVGNGISYKLAKYTDTTGTILTSNIVIAGVGLLRYGELMTGQFEKEYENESTTGLTTIYWLLTPYSTSLMRYVNDGGFAFYIEPSSANGIRPALNLKSNVSITGGNGTKEQPFTLV